MDIIRSSVADGAFMDRRLFNGPNITSEDPGMENNENSRWLSLVLGLCSRRREIHLKQTRCDYSVKKLSNTPSEPCVRGTHYPSRSVPPSVRAPFFSLRYSTKCTHYIPSQLSTPPTAPLSDIPFSLEAFENYNCHDAKLRTKNGIYV